MQRIFPNLLSVRVVFLKYFSKRPAVLKLVLVGLTVVLVVVAKSFVVVGIANLTIQSVFELPYFVVQTVTAVAAL